MSCGLNDEQEPSFQCSGERVQGESANAESRRVGTRSVIPGWKGGLRGWNFIGGAAWWELVVDGEAVGAR